VLPPATQRESRTKFKHPGYLEPNNCFLSLPQTDSRKCKTSGEVIFGVHHHTARVACGILAGNRFRTSYLALDRNAVSGVEVGAEDLLTQGEYYFIIPGDRKFLHSILFLHVLHWMITNACPLALYAIVPSFRDWIFPHDQLQRLWPQDPLERDNLHCGITNAYGVGAYLVPVQEESWYEINGMAFGQERRPDAVLIHDGTNTIYLKSDMHRPFHDGSFAIVPKLSPTGSMEYVMTVLSNVPEGTWSTFDGKQARPFATGSKPFLFARFAWAIFVHAKIWSGWGDGRTLLRLGISGSTYRVSQSQKRKSNQSYSAEDQR
jgi:hypothetical protein